MHHQKYFFNELTNYAFSFKAVYSKATQKLHLTRKAPTPHHFKRLGGNNFPDFFWWKLSEPTGCFWQYEATILQVNSNFFLSVNPKRMWALKYVKSANQD